MADEDVSSEPIIKSPVESIDSVLNGDMDEREPSTDGQVNDSSSSCLKCDPKSGGFRFEVETDVKMEERAKMEGDDNSPENRDESSDGEDSDILEQLESEFDSL